MLHTENQDLPIFPLPLVLFPGMRLPLHIFEERYKTMMTQVMANDQQFGITLYLKTTDENIGISTAVGTLAQILETEEQAGGRMDILVKGVERFKIIDVDHESHPYLQAVVEPYQDDDSDPLDSHFIETMKEKYSALIRLYQKMINEQTQENTASEITSNKRLNTENLNIESLTSEELSYRIGERLNQDITVQQGLLELQSTRERLEREQAFIDPLINRLVAMTQINAAFSPEQ